jgi:fibronectin type 3 domain-containing protein
MIEPLEGRALLSNLIVDGDFETPQLSIPTIEYLPAGETDTPGWQVTGGAAGLSKLWPAADGEQVLDLSYNFHGTTVEQTFATSPGQSYQLSFAYANVPPDAVIGGTASGRAEVQVVDSATGGRLIDLGFIHAGSTTSAMNYQMFTEGFTASGASTTLRFEAVDPGIVIDSVVVAASPQVGQVTGLTATLVAASGAPPAVNLAWTAPAESGPGPGTDYTYQIYRSVDFAAEQPLATTSAITYSDTTVAPGHAYTYRIAAEANGVMGSESDPATATYPVPPTVAAPTAGLVHPFTSGVYVSVTWSSPDLTAHLTYQLYRSVDGGAEQPVGDPSAYNNGQLATGGSYNDTAVSPGHNYTYRVAAEENGVMGPESDPATVTYRVAPTLAAPIAGLASPFTSAATAVVRWSYPEGGELTYQLYRSVDGGAEQPVGDPSAYNHGELFNTGGSYEDTAVSAGHNYTYRVTAVFQGTAGPKSDPVTVTYPGPPAVAAPEAIFISAFGVTSPILARPTEVEVTWNSPTGLSRGASLLTYRVFRSVDGGPYLERTAAPVSGFTYFFDTSVPPGHTFQYRVAAVYHNLTGPQSNLSNLIDYRIPQVTHFNKQLLNRFRNAAPDLPAMLALDWTAPPPSRASFQYRVYRGVDGGPVVPVSVAPQSDRAYKDSTVRPGHVYTYQVSVVFEGVEGARSTPIVLDDYNPPIVTLSGSGSAWASQGYFPYVQLRWPPLFPATPAFTFKVYRVNSPAGDGRTLVGTTAHPYFTAYGVIPGRTYYYGVSAVYQGVEGKLSDVIAVTVSPPRPTPP